MSFNITASGSPEQAAKKLRDPEQWFRGPTIGCGAETADYVAAMVEKVTDGERFVVVEANGHVDEHGASVNMTVRTYPYTT